MTQADLQNVTVYTIGHSTRPVDVFVRMLKAHRVMSLVDVRTIPRSRHNPQFNRESLNPAMDDAGISYIHAPLLGGLRKPSKVSPNTAWRNPSFRGYADYMGTSQFETGIGELVAIARESMTAVMCAEAVPWRCHRSLIADALLVRRLTVEHIMEGGSLRTHILTPGARVRGTTITYPAVS